MAIKLPKGFYDMLFDEKARWERFKRSAFAVFSTYGYREVETPIVEPTELFVRGIGEATDVVSKEMFTAISGENLKTLVGGGHVKPNARLTLRPEGTAGIVRAAMEHNLAPAGAAPAKLMYAGPMFRAENPQQGRQRQFNQVGIECLGACRPSVDAEGIVMLMRFLAAVGIPTSDMRLYVNSMGCEQCRPAYREVVRAHLAAHESELCDDCRRRMDANPLRAFDCKRPGCSAVMDAAPRFSDHLCDDCKSHHDQVKAYLDAACVPYKEDFKLVRGLDYYTRTVFEVQSCALESAQNALGGGGRYDKLAQDVGGQATPGFGFALGYERCALALAAAGVAAPHECACRLFVACVTDAERARAFDLVQQLRDAGIAADMSHQARSLKSQFKLADKLGAAYVAVIGPDEAARDAVRLRDMATHDEREVARDELVSCIAE